MKKKLIALLAVVALSLPALGLASPTIYPRGTTIYDPAKAWNGYTVLTMLDMYQADGYFTYIIDMNGNTAHVWDGLASFPGKVFPGGLAMGFDKYYGANQDTKNLQVRDFNNKVLWQWSGVEKGTDGDLWSRQHHDYQVSGSPTGYYAPGQTPDPTKGKMLILSHTDVKNEKISDKMLLDDIIYEVDVKSKKVVWSWKISDSFDQLGFDDASKVAMNKNPNMSAATKLGDWAHINSASYVGPNKWWDTDPVKYAAFNPENIIWDARDLNIIGITDRKGNVVWKVGPYYNGDHPEKKLGWIIGQHHAHMIPAGLPGAGNILVYDNGGYAGYGENTINAPTGNWSARRDYSRVIEFDPVSLEIVWEYSPKTMKSFLMDNVRHYSPYISGAQRLPNGNTMITEGSYGRIFEVTAEHEIVWEHIGPSTTSMIPGGIALAQIYRAYRLPYEWVPQLKKPVETAIVPNPLWDSRIPTTKNKAQK